MSPGGQVISKDYCVNLQTQQKTAFKRFESSEPAPLLGEGPANPSSAVRRWKKKIGLMKRPWYFAVADCRRKSACSAKKAGLTKLGWNALLCPRST
jgi:hypothetical protein